ncbi:hypothetical protein H5P28_00495 [Ruficoccus amylovorans]|uniref:Uncharacterized protein n=1 Tax=Ruficoccus amylovorans TaxID=1804625 RepID=A0A842H9D7_9BACT|nr:hypothetical protein [Ruficoccus amylovorans]MBC2592729.1 hypothetical protein [Ruficoccus amylovorans]
MKHASKLLAAFSLLSVAALPSQADTAYTDPVMAASTSLGEGMHSIGIVALNPIEATGVISAINTYAAEGYTYSVLDVTNVPSDWATYDYDNEGWVVKYNKIYDSTGAVFQDVPMYYLEVTSGDKQGQILDVIATGADSGTNTLTVGEDLSGMDEFIGASFAIREKHTLANVFGASNEKVGLTGGTNFTKADLVYVQVDDYLDIFFYQDWPDEYNNDGWRQIRKSTVDMANLCIDPDFGIMIYRREGGAPVNMVTTGDVKLGTARTTFLQGLNPINMKFPVGMTLGTSGLYDPVNPVLQSGTNFTKADLVYVFSPELDAFDIYFYQDWPDEYDNDGWRQIRKSSISQDDLSIPSGAMIIIYRRSSEPTEWTLPQPFALDGDESA